MSEILQYLEALDPAALNYTEWVQCGMALKEEGYPVSVWDHWSARDPARYKEGECSRKWETFHGSGDIVTGGTIFQICKDKGLLAKADFMDWDDTFIADSGADPVAWHPGQEIRQYLEALFDPSESRFAFWPSVWLPLGAKAFPGRPQRGAMDLRLKK